MFNYSLFNFPDSPLWGAHSSATTLALANTSISNHHLQQAWHDWQTSVLQGTDESRDIAVERLKDCQQYGHATLDLQGLNLTELPPHLPNHINTLTISDNRLEQIAPDSLPATLKILIACRNPHLSALPDMLPDSLQMIDVASCSLSHLPEQVPPALLALFAGKNNLRNFPEVLTGLSRHAYIDLSDNPLELSALQYLCALDDVQDYQGPPIKFHMWHGDLA